MLAHMMRDVWGRPIGYRSPSPWDQRRAPVRAPHAPSAAQTSPWFEARRPLDPDVRAPEPRAEPRAPEPRAERIAEPRAADSSARSDAPASGAHLAEARAHFHAAQAEIDASRARLAREATREREADKLRLVGEVLPVLDDLDRSIAAAHADANVKPTLIEGFELVRARLERVLAGYGLERIAAVGERFDPSVHEAIALVEVDDEAKQGFVVDEIARGYRAGDRVLRAAMVRVGSLA
jgi:molecular chaperone GrpE